MSQELLVILVVIPTVAVVVALIYVMWSARTSARTTLVALVAGVLLAAWGVATAVLAISGAYSPGDLTRPPTVGVELAISLAAMTGFLVFSPALRSLLTNQRHLIRLNVWRLVGAVFLGLMVAGQAPALWALPAGVGDVIVGATAFWVASRLGAAGGRALAVAFNIFGLSDLVVAIGFGFTTSPGPAQLFHTPPTAEIMTRFPMALVPTFLVPLAFVLHFVSLWQLLGRPWGSPANGRSMPPVSNAGAADRRQEEATHPVFRSGQ